MGLQNAFIASRRLCCALGSCYFLLLLTDCHVPLDQAQQQKLGQSSEGAPSKSNRPITPSPSPSTAAVSADAVTSGGSVPPPSTSNAPSPSTPASPIPAAEPLDGGAAITPQLGNRRTHAPSSNGKAGASTPDGRSGHCRHLTPQWLCRVMAQLQNLYQNQAPWQVCGEFSMSGLAPLISYPAPTANELLVAQKSGVQLHLCLYI